MKKKTQNGQKGAWMGKIREDWKFISIFMKVSFTVLENHPCLLCGRDFANERILLCQFEVRALK